MKTIVLVFMVAIRLSQAVGLEAQSGEAPTIVLNGLKAYQTTGPESALHVWLAGSPLIGGEQKSDGMTESLRRIRQHYGMALGFSILRVVQVNDRFVRTYVMLQHERGPVFAFFDTYRGEPGWLTTGLLFNTQPALILPADMLSHSRTDTMPPNEQLNNRSPRD